MISKNWNQKDVQVLKKVYSSRPNYQIAKTLRRTPKAIERKAAKLNLRKSKTYLRSLGRKV